MPPPSQSGCEPARTLPVIRLLLTTASPKTKTPPPDTFCSTGRTSPLPPVILQLSIEKSVRFRQGKGAGGGPQTGLPEAKTTAARPLPVASMVVVEVPAHCTCTFGQTKILSG